MPTGSDPTSAVKPATVDSYKLVSRGDLALVVGLPVMGLVSWALPERFWRRFCLATASLSLRMLSSDPGSTARRIGRMLGGRTIACSGEDLIRSFSGWSAESTLQCLKDYRPGGWTPAIQLLGREHIEAALGRGRGAILWIGNFVFRDLIPKIALHRAGYSVSHLSHPRHGFSATHFAMRTLNHIRTFRADRYLGERVMISLDGPVGAMRVLHRRLRANGVVSITVGRRALQPATVAFMDGRITVATGALDLARATKAALLPVFPVRNEAGLLTVAVAPALDVSQTLSRRAAAEAALRQYAGLLETQVLKYPDQWEGWFNI